MNDSGYYLELSDGSGKLLVSQVQGNSGKFIVRLIRIRADSKKEPTVITKSLWQIVKAVPGTWLTTVAKYGLNWPDKDLHRVYFNEYVQACEPGSDDTKADYHFFDFEEGGKWEDGINNSPKTAKARDHQVEIDSYWGFKLAEIVVYQKPELDDDEILQRRKKLMDSLLLKALAMDDKNQLLNELNKLEQDVENIDNLIRHEEQKLAEHCKILEQLKETVKKYSRDPDVALAGERLYQLQEETIKGNINSKGRLGSLVKQEIKYLKFRCAEYDLIHDSDQQVEKIQKGTSEENQWEKMLPLLPLKKPEDKIKLFSPKPGIGPS